MSNQKSRKSELDRLCDKFKDAKGLITATNIREAGIARDKTAQYRRDLLNAAVKRGDAWPNCENSNDNKYGIYFNAVESIKSSFTTNTPEYFLFSQSVMLNPAMIDLPPKQCLPEFSTPDRTFLFLQHKSEWTEIYRGFCQFQAEGKVGLTSWNAHWDMDLRDNVLLKTKEYIQTYKVIKLCCDWISNNGSPCLITFDDIFIAILKADATDGFYGDISCHPAKTKFQSHYNYFNEILKARENGVFHSSQYDESMKQEKEMLENMFRLLAKDSSPICKAEREELGIFDNIYSIQTYIEKSEDPLLKKALKDLQQAKTDNLKFRTKLYRRGKDSKAHRPTGGWTDDGRWVTDATAMSNEK